MFRFEESFWVGFFRRARMDNRRRPNCAETESGANGEPTSQYTSGEQEA